MLRIVTMSPTGRQIAYIGCMGRNAHPLTPAFKMGLIADKLRARLDEMAARHAQTDREIAELRIEAQAAYDRWEAAAAALDAELAD